MTSRDRIKAILSKEVPDRMGLFEHFWPETLPSAWHAQGFTEGVDPQVHYDHDIWMCGGWIDSQPFCGRSEIVEETDEWQLIRDGRGARMKTWKNKSGTPEHVAFEMDSPEVWAQYREQLLDTNPARLGDLRAQKYALDYARARGKFSIMGNLFVFEIMRASIGDENFLPALLLEPDWIKDFCEVYLDFYKRHYALLFKEVGVPDGFLTYEDFGYTNGLFCSPKVLKEMIMPYEKQWVAFLKENGIQTILHSCGDIREAVPQIIDAGYDCLQPMEAKAGVHVVELAKEYAGQIAFMGNIDVVELTTNDRARIEAEIVPKLRRLKEMRVPYVFHSDHSIPPNVTMQTYEYALQLFRENANY